MPEFVVVDCSVAAKWVLPEPERDLAMALLDRQEQGAISLIAPDLLLAEFASLLSKRARRRQISYDQAIRAFELFMDFAPRLFAAAPRLPEALRLSLRCQLSLWDSVYLTLALEHGCPFVTADRRLFRGSRGRHPSITLLS